MLICSDIQGECEVLQILHNPYSSVCKFQLNNNIHNYTHNKIHTRVVAPTTPRVFDYSTILF